MRAILSRLTIQNPAEEDMIRNDSIIFCLILPFRGDGPKTPCFFIALKRRNRYRALCIELIILKFLKSVQI
ncbi:hypothetical protein IC3_04672 [Bacillus cereus VD142]|nr:hypothetical protein IC3_04672 [Bacillus cereus VD142]